MSNLMDERMAIPKPTGNPLKEYMYRQIEQNRPDLLIKPLTVKNVFGTQGTIGDRVSSFDFSKISNSNNPGLIVGLAPSYGNLYTQSYKAMDDNLKVMLVTSMRSIWNIPDDQRNYKRINEVLMMNPLLETNDNDNIVRGDSLRKSGTNAFKDGGIDQGVVKEVASWFTGFIGDEDVLRNTKIDINMLGRIVAQTGAMVTSFETLFHSEDHRSMNICEIGVMRFPDIEKPYIQVYYIKLYAYSSSVRDLFVTTESSAITGEYYSRKYRPNAAAMKALAPEVLKKGIKDAENLFAD